MKVATFIASIITIINAVIGVGIFLVYGTISLFGGGQVIHAQYASGSIHQKLFIVAFVGSCLIMAASLAAQPIMIFILIKSKEFAFKFLMFSTVIVTCALAIHMIPYVWQTLQSIVSTNAFELDTITTNFIILFAYQCCLIYFVRFLQKTNN